MPNFSFTKNIRNKSMVVGKTRGLSILNTGKRNNVGKKTVLLKKYIRYCSADVIQKRVGTLIQFHHFFKKKCLVGVIKYSNGALSNIKVPSGAAIGDYILSSSLPPFGKKNTQYSVGYTVLLFWLPLKSIFYNISSEYHKSVTIARAPGTYFVSLVSDFDQETIKVKLPTGLTKKIFSLSYVRLGRNSNEFNKKLRLGKAGNKAKIGGKPKVRGVAKNPVDHPNGGRTKAFTPNKTPWGSVAKKSK